jgi:hypothetical protein
MLVGPFLHDVEAFLHDVEAFLASYSEIKRAGSRVGFHEATGESDNQNGDQQPHADGIIWLEWLLTL